MIRGQHLVGDAHVVGGQAVLLDLAGQDEAPGDLDLLLLGVAGDADDLHAVEQRAGDGVQHVGRADEHDLGEVEGHAQVVVREGEVLLRVQDLEQGRGRVAPEVRAHLVDLVEHDHRVARAGGA